MEAENLRFAKTHEWVFTEGEIATVGISDFAVKELTDLVFVELPTVGETVSAGDAFGVVESVKAAADLYAPVGGEIVEINEALPDHLEFLSDDPFGKGWIAKVRLVDVASVDRLMDYANYQRHCEAGSH